MVRRSPGDVESIHTRLRAAREHAGLSQEQIAEAIGKLRGLKLRQSRVSSWEVKGERPDDADVEHWGALTDAAPGWLTHGVKGGAGVPSWWDAWRRAHPLPPHRAGPVQLARPHSQGVPLGGRRRRKEG